MESSMFENCKYFYEKIRKLFSKWKPLIDTAGRKVLLWRYDENENIPVIYRFVIYRKDAKDKYTIYVGSGENLSGREGPKSLVHQYNRGERIKGIRPRIEEEIHKFKVKWGENRGTWTEVIRLDGTLRNKRKVLENLAIAKYWLEYVERLNNAEREIPKFLNRKIEELDKVARLLSYLKG